mmetsp:Transcript_11260/g.25646  ORF Transcript_11260/g.25646 Transcript_11260/m.25646 type:complete len:109 (-) Transcript_11260:100-426(-)
MARLFFLIAGEDEVKYDAGLHAGVVLRSHKIQVLYDDNRDHKLSFKEFEFIFGHETENITEPKIRRELFEEFDEDKSGFLTVHEIDHMAGHLIANDHLRAQRRDSQEL